ncbi:hypothetical protein WJX74_004681 [Apatococcus lobatus]|uniref:Uncharacterized protein n=2 Tax=Apatococcus TaxID=904362 RepID=A0AAW1QUQ5_9CHLO
MHQIGENLNQNLVLVEKGLGALNIWRRMWLLPLKLTADEKQLLETIFDARHVAGDRYNPAMMSMTQAGGKA